MLTRILDWKAGQGCAEISSVRIVAHGECGERVDGPEHQMLNLVGLQWFAQVEDKEQCLKSFAALSSSLVKLSKAGANNVWTVGAGRCKRVCDGLEKTSWRHLLRAQSDWSRRCQRHVHNVWVLDAHRRRQHSSVAATESDHWCIPVLRAQHKKQLCVIRKRLLNAQVRKVLANEGVVAERKRLAVVTVLREHNQGVELGCDVENETSVVVEGPNHPLIPAIEHDRPARLEVLVDHKIALRERLWLCLEVEVVQRLLEPVDRWWGDLCVCTPHSQHRHRSRKQRAFSHLSKAQELLDRSFIDAGCFGKQALLT
eukprot:m.260055 g.260055  ORF g.260055 m.260055 type:complete len:313 (-) comp54593_c0_seq1:2064-3002(-)